MTKIPETLNYTREHEWVLIENDQGTIGITDFAQQALGDIVYIELPEVGKSLEKNKTFGVVESIKSVSDLFAPLNGKVIEINQALIDSPEMCNQDPYGTWMVKIKITQQQQVATLLNHLQYKEHCDNIS